MFIIGGHYRRQQLVAPKGNQTRPTSNALRETLFNICQSSIAGARFLDIFAGSGAVGLEALSRGATSATFIESDREAIRCIEKNIIHLGVTPSTSLLKGDVRSLLARLEKQQTFFDLIYADPPYGVCLPGSAKRYSLYIVEWIDAHQLLVPGGSLFVEEDARQGLSPERLQTLQLNTSRRMGGSSLSEYRSLLA